MSQLKTIYVINHTHWDREWYETKDTYLAKLKTGVLYLLDKLDRGEVANFFFDGQTIVVEDLRDVLNHADFERFEAYLFAGKIEIGPWYVLSDGFLCDEETYMQNLAIGMEIAERYNQRVPLAYLPDTFGHIGQIPQIMHAHGIETAFIHRGANSKTVETMWEGSDGSVLKTFVLPLNSGYYQTMFHEEQTHFLTAIAEYVAATQSYQVADSIVILNGCDHTFMPDDFAAKMTQLEQAYPGVTIKQVVMSEYLEAVLPTFSTTERITAEQQAPGKAYVLPGVWSTRTYLKQQNRQLVDTLTTQVEPLLAWLNASETNTEYVTYLWKKALQNIPHDSLCGCSIDEVHREMEIRTQQGLDGAKRLMTEMVHLQSPLDFTQTQLGMNPYFSYYHEQVLPGKYTQTVEICVPASTEQPRHLRLQRQGQDIPLEIFAVEREERLFATYNQAPSYQNVDCYQVCLTDDFTGRGCYQYEINLEATPCVLAVRESCEMISNAFYEVSVDSGILRCYRKSDQKYFDNWLIFKHELDAGDTYNYSAPQLNPQQYGRIMHAQAYKQGPKQWLTLTYELTAPAKLDENRQMGSEQWLTMPITVEIELTATDEQMRIALSFDQKFQDAKIQLGCSLNQAKLLQADTAFELVERTIGTAVIGKAAPQKEIPWTQFPTLRHIYVPTEKIQITHDGLTEGTFTQLPTANYVWLTLVRAVGWLSRRDLNSRGGGAGPSYVTPEAQCQRQYNCQLQISLEAQTYQANTYQQLVPRFAVQGNRAMSEYDFVASDNPAIQITRTVQNENALHVRLVNPTHVEQETQLTVFGQTTKAVLAPKTFMTVVRTDERKGMEL